MSRKKASLFRFNEKNQSEGAPTNIFYLISHYTDPEDNKEKLILKDSGTIEVLIADVEDVEEVEGTFEDKMLFCLTDISESLRIIAKQSEDHQEPEELDGTLPAAKEKKNFH